MLVLAREVKETIHMRDKATGRYLGEVMLVSVENRFKVKLGFNCPDDVEVIRGELLYQWRGREVNSPGCPSADGAVNGSGARRATPEPAEAPSDRR